MRRRLSRNRASGPLCVLVALIVILCQGAAPSQAYVLAGQRWHRHTIRYHDGGPNHAAVRAAARAWNASGAHLHLVPAHGRRADVEIRTQTPAGCVGQEGFGTIGYSPLGDHILLRSCRNQPESIITAVHEFGHVLGLDHETHRCATMNPVDGQGPCGTPPDYSTHCRPLELDDEKGAARLFGGHARAITGPKFCPDYGPPRAPASVAITGNSPPAQQLVANFTVPAERRLIEVPIPKGFPGFGGKQPRFQPAPQPVIAVYRYAATCPAVTPAGRKALVELPLNRPGKATIPLGYRTELTPGAWCYAVEVSDLTGRRAATLTTATVIVSRRGPTAAFEVPDEASAGDALTFYDTSDLGEESSIRSQKWAFGDGGLASGPNPSHVYKQPGTYPVSLTVTGGDGQTSTVSHPVTIAATPTPDPYGDG